ESDLPGAAADTELDAASSAAEAAGAVEQVRATNAMEADGLRQARRLALRAIEKLGATRMEDVGAPRSKLVELLDAIQRVVSERGLNCGTFGHAGDGNLHPTFWWERGDAEAESRVTAACEELYRAAIELGGTVTGEHGIGVARGSEEHTSELQSRGHLVCRLMLERNKYAGMVIPTALF